MRKLRRVAFSAMLAVAPVAVAVGPAGAATVVGGERGRPIATVDPTLPSPSSLSGPTVIRLSRLHHAAAREVQLGRLAQLSAHRPETRAYGARLVADFQALDERVSAKAAQLGIDPAMLGPTYAGENTDALAREAADLTRLGAARGDDLDLQFWVVVAQDQLAATDMLLPVADAEPQLEPLVAEIGRQLEASSRAALLAAAPVAVLPRGSVPPAAVAAPPGPAAPVTSPGL